MIDDKMSMVYDSESVWAALRGAWEVPWTGICILHSSFRFVYKIIHLHLNASHCFNTRRLNPLFPRLASVQECFTSPLSKIYSSILCLSLPSIDTHYFS